MYLLQKEANLRKVGQDNEGGRLLKIIWVRPRQVSELINSPLCFLKSVVRKLGFLSQTMGACVVKIITSKSPTV